MLLMRSNSGVSSTSALFLFLLPFGRPRGRFAMGFFCFLASAFALLATFSASVRTTCSTRIGKERRACTSTRESAKKDNPGMGLPYRLA